MRLLHLENTFHLLYDKQGIHENKHTLWKFFDSDFKRFDQSTILCYIIRGFSDTCLECF